MADASSGTKGHEEDIPEEEDEAIPAGLLGDITPGQHDGFLVEDVGMAGFGIRERLGIEPIVARATQGTEAGFFEWVQRQAGVALEDWEPATLVLHECWVEVPEGHYDMGAFCRRTWSASGQWKDALSIRPVQVFAVRHRAWPLLKDGRVRSFYVALQRSVFDAIWRRDHPGVAPTPADWFGGDQGFVVHGRPRGAERSVCLSWPAADLGAVIDTADELLAQGTADLVIYQCGGAGLTYSDLTRGAWHKMAAADRARDAGELLTSL